MDIAGHNSVRSPLVVRNYDGLIKFGYVAFAIIVIALLYFASTGPGLSEAELAMASVFP